MVEQNMSHKSEEDKDKNKKNWSEPRLISLGGISSLTRQTKLALPMEISEDEGPPNLS